MNEDEGRKNSDPIDNDYSGLDEGWRNTAPDFGRGIADGDDGLSARMRRRKRNDAATSSARDAEEKASGGAAGLTAERSSMMNGGESAARTQERSGFYTGSGRSSTKSKTGAGAAGASAVRGNFRGRMKGKGPFFLVGAIISFAMILVASSQVMAPFALVANALDEFNSLRTSMQLRGNMLSKFQLNRKTNVSLTTGGVFSTEKFKISKSMQRKLAKHNITYSEDGGRHLIYKNDLTGKTLNITVDNLDDMLATNDDFFRDYDLSTRTIKGHFAGWFDSVSEKFHSRIVNNRNRFKDVDDTADDDEIQEAAKKTGLDGDEISQSNTDGENKDEWDKVKEEEVDDGKGGKTKKEVETGGYNDVEVDDSIKRDDIVDDTGKVKGTAVDTAQNRMSARAQKVLSAGGELLNASQMVCGFMKTIGAISAVATAIQRANIINYVTASLEMIQKTQAGDGGNEIHYLMNGLSQKGDTTGVSETGEITTVKSGTAAMESPAFNHFFGGSPVSASDPVARKYNTDNSFSTMLAMNLSVNDSGQDADEALVNRKSAGGFWSWLFGRDKENQYDKTALANGGVKKAVSDFIPEVNALLSSGNGNKLANYKKCLMMRASAALTDIVSDVITLVTTGPLAFFKQAIESVVQMAIRTMLMTAVSAVISAIVPRLVEWLAKDMMTNMMGEDAAYALDAGVHMYLGEQEQSSTGKPGTEAEAIAMHNATQQIIAEEARYDRLTHSPFDITNKNTFMGSIVYSLIPIGLSLYTSPTTLLSRATSTVGSALNSILPAVSAVDEGVHFKQELNNDCPSLSEFGLVGDAYCSPYYVSTYASDNVLLETDPYDIFKEICDGNFENNCDMEDGGNTDVENPSDDNESTYGYNPKIKKDSDLGKWVVACSARTTQFGYVDGQEYQLFSTGNGAADTILNVGTGMIPILGSLVDLGSSAEDAANIKWSSGEECLSDRSKLYSAYSEDQRWMENAGIVEDSAIAVYLDDWYKEHPLDNSEEGIIARYSGLTIDQVEETLGMVELYDFVANYDPSGLGPKVDAPVAEDGWQYDGPGVVAELFPEAKVAYYIVYSDLRSRTVIV